MAGVDLRTVADPLGHFNLQMTMRCAHLAQGHKAAPVEKLPPFNAIERRRHETVILFPAGPEKPTDTTPEQKVLAAAAVEMVSKFRLQ
jgi:hypothetical protein